MEGTAGWAWVCGSFAARCRHETSAAMTSLLFSRRSTPAAQCTALAPAACLRVTAISGALKKTAVHYRRSHTRIICRGFE